MSVRLLKEMLTVALFIAAVVISGCAEKQDRPAPSSQVRFDDIQKWINAYEDPDRHIWQKPEEVIKKMNIRLNDVIADIGAGTGYFTRRFAFAALTGKAVGLDVEPSMVRYMKKDAKKLGLKNYEARIVKFDDPELGKHTTDIVFLCDTYHHIDNRVEYFSNVAGSLKKGGRLVIVDFYKEKLPYGPPPDRKLAKEIVISELEEAGYKLLRSHDFLPYQYFLEFGVQKRA
jgi:ubiquinone/menaquinone biosynthesis C-methylase UbiE